MGVGKSTIGKQLAKRLERKFVDIDKGLDNTIKWFIDNYDSCRK